ncbi:glycosyltransferase family 2 protein [Azohydromonas caseinilytica]|uniref:Glycosyltransferase family 2 protein n=1 Tax=Azohydromonas caseinilytica TaxID=2728836 RepID=A0A848F8K6_9BURK|nr:glycosyltransferase family 2 protein [Azohydromonas caseinilytica]NML15096.1 glycosyltransferase family 2 protein [Azohydromonas caseinilytica]
MTAATPKLVSVIVPCRNERGHIAAFCASARAQQLPPPWTLELLIADGQSDDGTREELQRLATADAHIRVIDNPGRIVSCGLNRALAAARGEIIVRMDVHTTYAPDYVAQCVAALQRSGAAVVGGPWRAEGAAPWQRAIAAAFQSRWVSGGARSRQLDYEGEADTVYLGAWPRESFARFGGFDEQLVRNQDDEHNLRITRGGGRVWQSARIRSLYRPRGSVRALFRQWLQYGYWKPFVMRKHGQPAALRQLVPGLFVGGQLLLTGAALLGASWVLPLGWLAAYGAALGTLSLLVAADGHWALLPRLPVVIAAHHVGYGIGTLLGWWDVLRHGRGRERFSKLTR